MKHCEADWRVAAHCDGECGEPQGEIPFDQHNSGAWDDKMRALEVIRREIEPQLVANREALDDGGFGFESDWHERQV